MGIRREGRKRRQVIEAKGEEENEKKVREL
jgi:hypothetical protein